LLIGRSAIYRSIIPTMSNAELVVVRTFLNKIDAEMAHSALEAADIESIVSADDEGGLGPGLWMSGVRLLVRAEDAEQAGKILAPRTPRNCP
jgi:hypothetical protein